MIIYEHMSNLFLLFRISLFMEKKTKIIF